MTTIEQLVIETWVEYSCATVIVLLRYYVRIRMVGLRDLDYDDYIMPIAWVSIVHCCRTLETYN